MKRIMFVCSGNICRSPLAHRHFEAVVEEFAAHGEFEVESSGLGSWHVGENADPRMRATALEHGLKVNHRARQLTRTDLEEYDLILVMERSHKRQIERQVRDPEIMEKVRLFREWDPEGEPGAEVPDPYYGGDHGFETVYRMVERTNRALLAALLDADEAAAG